MYSLKMIIQGGDKAHKKTKSIIKEVPNIGDLPI